jgi:HNH endonuclease
VALIALDEEVARRRSLRDAVHALSGDLVVPARALRDLGIIAGERSVYRDSKRSDAAVDGGIALSLHHTGQSFDEDLGPAGILYHYPRTRQPGRDRADVLAIENAFRQRVPLFVVEDLSRSRRRVHWGWVQYINDVIQGCYVAFAETAPREMADLSLGGDERWSGLGRRVTRDALGRAVQRDPRFRFLVRSRYRDACLVTGVSVVEMLEATHVVPVADGGKDQAINGVLLEAGVRRAFDAHLWAIEPGTHRLVARREGPSLSDMGITLTKVPADAVLPAPEALAHRWERFTREG